MSTKISLSGHKFGLLSVLKYDNTVSGRDFYLCKCDCGKTTIIKAKYLLNGDTKSCGCLRSIKSHENGKKRTTHGLSNHPLFKVWSSMKDRCLNNKCHAFNDYGGRGICIDERWMDFKLFFEDVSPTYILGLELDRYPNNNGNYSNNNFRWTTPTENKRNRRNTLFITINDITKSIGEWSKDTGINHRCISNRIRSGKKGLIALFGSKNTSL